MGAQVKGLGRGWTVMKRATSIVPRRWADECLTSLGTRSVGPAMPERTNIQYWRRRTVSSASWLHFQKKRRNRDEWTGISDV